MVACSSEEESTPTNPTTPDTPEPNQTPTFTLPEVSKAGYEASDTAFVGWDLVFEDNFDTDLSQWTPWIGGAFNEELQFYRSSNLFVENDLLYIYGKKTQVTGRTNPFDETSKSFQYASGRIETKTTYGPRNIEGENNVRMSARIKLVEGEGLWPAFWSFNDPWPTMGEIDILEARGNTPNEFQTNFHFGERPNQLETSPAFNEFKYEHPTSLADEFHIYELEWSRDQFVIMFDGEIIKTYDQETFTFVDDFFNKKHRVVLNLAIGGSFFFNLDESKIPDESFLIVDWVKVHTR